METAHPIGMETVGNLIFGKEGNTNMDNLITSNPMVEEVIDSVPTGHDKKETEFDRLVHYIDKEAETFPDDAKLQLAIELKAKIRRSTTIVNLHNEIDILKSDYNNIYYFDMGKGPKSLLKRIVRKIIRCVVFPLNERQNSFNEHVAKGMDALRAICEEQQLQINIMSERMQQLQKDNDTLRSVHQAELHQITEKGEI